MLRRVKCQASGGYRNKGKTEKGKRRQGLLQSKLVKLSEPFVLDLQQDGHVIHAHLLAPMFARLEHALALVKE